MWTAFRRWLFATPAPALPERSGALALPSRDSGTVWSASANGADAPVYDIRRAMAAGAVFPWLRVGVETAARHLAGLPLIDPDTQQPIRDIPYRDRLQWWVSTLLAEETWAKTTDRSYLHPADGVVKDGRAVGYRTSDGRSVTAPVTWSAGITFSGYTNHRGTSPVASLEAMLNTEWSVDRLTARSAKRGHVSYIGTAKSDEVKLSDPMKKAFYAEWEKATQTGFGLYLLDEAFDLKPAQMSFRDMEFQAAVQRAQAAALALMHIPPVMSGLPSAGYGEARQQMRVFWGYYLERSEEMSRFLSDLYGRPVAHDFRRVDALQATETERLARAKTMASAPLNYAPAAAMGAQGYPAKLAGQAGKASADGQSGRPTGPQDEPKDRLARHLAASGSRWADGVADSETEEHALRATLLSCGMSREAAASRAALEVRHQARASMIAMSAGRPVQSIRVFSAVRAAELLAG